MAASYENPGGKYTRSRYITVTASSGLIASGSVQVLVDGNTSNNSCWFNATTASGRTITFVFSEGRFVITEAVWLQSSSAFHGSWKWQGSNDGSSWTDIGSSFTLGGSTAQTQTALSGNATAYSQYRLIGVSGNTSNGPFINEVEFLIDEVTNVTGPSYLRITGTGNRPGISVTTTMTMGGGAISAIVNGLSSTDGNGNFFQTTQAVSGKEVKFDFAVPYTVTEAYWQQQNTTGNATWKWQGSNDGSSWTDIGSTFTLGGATAQTQTELNGNATPYRYYRLLGVSGNTSAAPPGLYEIDFKLEIAPGISIVGVTGGSIEITGGANGSVATEAAVTITGSTGGSLLITGGTGGGVGNPFIGVIGGRIRIEGGANGEVSVAAQVTITGYAGGRIEIRGGRTGLVLATSDRPWAVIVAGVDRTKYIGANTINGRADLNSRASAQFLVRPEMGAGRTILSTWHPGVRDEVVIIYTRGGIWRMFGGFIEATEEEIFCGLGGYYEIAVTCTDYGAITDHRYVARWYDLFHGGVAGVFSADVIQSFLDGTGITGVYEPGGADVAIGNDNLINYLTASEAFNQIADKANIAWRIDYYGAFHWMLKDTGYSTAPFSIADDDGNWRSMKVREDKSAFWNSAIVRNSMGLTALQTDEYVASSATVIPTEYPTEIKPAILVDGVEVDDSLVVEDSERAGTPGWLWYYFAGGIGVFPSTPVTGTVQVIYPSRLSYVARAPEGTTAGALKTDAEASIAAVGRWEHLEEAKDVTNPADLQLYADAILEAGMTVPKILDIETDRPGLEPGQLLGVSVSNAAGDFLIESTSWAEIPDSIFYIRYQVQASNAPQRRSGAAFFQRLMTQARQAVDRVDSGVAFTLAETIPGIVNPGLQIDADQSPPQQAIRTARKNGYLRLVTLKFKSIEDGTLTTQDIEIDLLKNGVSVFPSGAYMKIKAGSTQPAQRFRFATNPYPVTAGDVFTIAVISADSAAHDGFLEAQVMG